MIANKLGTERGIFYDCQARMLTPGSPSERRRNTSNVITAGDWAVRLRDWTALVPSVVRASVSARVNFPVSLLANVLVSDAAGGTSRRIAC